MCTLLFVLYDCVSYHAIMFVHKVGAQMRQRNDHFIGTCHFIAASCLCNVYHFLTDVCVFWRFLLFDFHIFALC